MSINSSIINSIKNNGLQNLSVQSRTLSDLSELAETIKNNTSLKVIEFSDCKIKSIKPLAEALVINKSIEIIDLCNDKIDDLDELFKSLIQINETSNLKSLELCDCINNCSIDFCNFIKSNKIITNLNLTYNNKLNVPEFYEALKEATFKEVFLCGCNINSLTDISETLKVNKSIEKLVLGENNIYDITPLNEVLPVNKTLKILDLSHNKVKDLKLSLETLQENNTLEALIFCDNKIESTNKDLENLINSKNIDLNVNDNPMTKMFEYFIVSIKSYDKEGDTLEYFDKFHYYGSDVKKILKNKQINDKNIDYILKYNNETKQMVCYKFNEDLTYTIFEHDFNVNKKIILEKDLNQIAIGIGGLRSSTSYFDYAFKKSKGFNKKLVACTCAIWDFCDKDILKSEYKLKN